MSVAEQVIERIEVAGGVLAVRGDRIRCRLPEDVAHLLDDLKTHKSEVIACLKQRDVPQMPQGVQLVRWEPKPAPVLLSRVTVVNDVPQFIRTTLDDLDRALHSEPETVAEPEVRELVDRLEQCGVVVKVQGIGSPSGGKR